VIDSVFEKLRQLNQEHFRYIWQSARSRQLDGLTEEEQRLAEIMLAHSDEFFNQFEFADLLENYTLDPDSEVNPFLHIVLHAVAEKQVEGRDPIEAFQFYNTMRQKKCSRHEAIHLLMAILIHFLFPALKKKGQIQLAHYLKLLKEYKSRKPEKIISLLENEPDLILEDAVETETARIFDEMHSALEGQNFKSIEKAQAFANAFMKTKNKEPMLDFLGLTPEQMHCLLNRPLADNADIVMLNKDISRGELADIPVTKEIVYFLTRLGELQPLKATVKGNLPRAFAQEIHDKFPAIPEFPYPIMSEIDDPKLMALRHILDMSGWIKKQNGKFSLTRSGKRIADDGFGPDDFYALLDTYMLKFNWAYRDRYPDLRIIQQAVLFSCYLLHRKAKTYIHTDELCGYFMQAFPAVLKLKESLPSMGPEELVRGAFSIRFIEHFCEYCGLVTIRREKKKSLKVERLVQTSPLFEKIFRWKLGAPGDGEIPH
jgi:hypothetical protein